MPIPHHPSPQKIPQPTCGLIPSLGAESSYGFPLGPQPRRVSKVHGCNSLERCARKAYRSVIPPLSGYRNICEFIACAAYGILQGVIKDENGAKLLCAAQVALATVPRESKSSKTQTMAPLAGRRFTPPLPHFCRNPIKIKGLAQKHPFRPVQTKNLRPTHRSVKSKQKCFGTAETNASSGRSP